MTDSNGYLKRSERGRFARGTAPGPGRKTGTPNRTTCDLRTLRDRIAASWDRVNGDALLDQLAEKDPARYLELVCRILPRDHALELTEPTKVVQLTFQLDAPPPDNPQFALYEQLKRKDGLINASLGSDHLPLENSEVA